MVLNVQFSQNGRVTPCRSNRARKSILGTRTKRSIELIANQLVKGDTLVVTRRDRLGRNTKQLLELTEILVKRMIHLVILNLGIVTRTPSGKCILTVMSAFSELNRTMIKEKQDAGIMIAK